MEQANYNEIIERGKKIIFEERHEEWERCVKKGFEGLYRGHDVIDALKIMEYLENGMSIDDASDLLRRSGQSSESTDIVCDIIYCFSSFGPDFWEANTSTIITDSIKKMLDEKREKNTIQNVKKFGTIHSNK